MAEITTIEESKKFSFGKFLLALALVVLAYALAIGAAFGIGYGLTILTWHPLWITLVADVGATIVIFIFSIIFKNVSFYDPYWSVHPIVIAVYWMQLPQAAGANPVRQMIIIGCVAFYCTRLTLNWVRGWKGLHHEDWRYVKFRKENPKTFPLIAFFGLEMMPTLIVYLSCIALRS